MPAAEHAPTAQAAQRLLQVDVGDGLLNTLVAGAGLEVVMLHGWTLDHRSWHPQLPLAQDVRLILPDRRGFGRSTAPANLAREWQDVDRLAVGDAFVLIGLSQGASVALDYARRRPERLKALVLIGAPLHGIVPEGETEGAIRRADYADMIRAGQLAAMKDDWRSHALVRSNAAAAGLIAAMLGDYDGRDLLAGFEPLELDTDAISALPMPVLAITGSSDTEWRREVAIFIAATAPHGQIASVDHAGHLCNLDNPAQFNAILAELFSSILH